MRRRTLTRSVRLPRLECSWTAADQSPLFSGIDHFGVSCRDRVAASAEGNSRLERSPEMFLFLRGIASNETPHSSGRPNSLAASELSRLFTPERYVGTLHLSSIVKVGEYETSTHARETTSPSRPAEPSSSSSLLFDGWWKISGARHLVN